MRRDLEIKAAGGREPSEVLFGQAHWEFEQGVRRAEDAAQVGGRLRGLLGGGRAAVALMLHCEIIDTTGEFFEGERAARAAEVAAVLGLGELDEVVCLLADERYRQAQAVLGAAAVLSRAAGGAIGGEFDGGQA